jgi:hypothetical protein
LSCYVAQFVTDIFVGGERPSHGNKGLDRVCAFFFLGFMSFFWEKKKNLKPGQSEGDIGKLMATKQQWLNWLAVTPSSQPNLQQCQRGTNVTHSPAHQRYHAGLLPIFCEPGLVNSRLTRGQNYNNLGVHMRKKKKKKPHPLTLARHTPSRGLRGDWPLFSNVAVTKFCVTQRG